MNMPPTMRGAMLLGPERIEIRDVDVPRPGVGEFVLRIRAATTCGTDVKVFRRGGHPRMLKVPTLFGHEMAGEVAAVGAGVVRVAVGDRVVIANSAACGTCQYCDAARENLCPDLHYINGAFAEYLLVPARFAERSTYPIPAGLSFARAALSEPLACVLHGIDACELATRNRNGALDAVVFGGGPIGLLFVAALARAGVDVMLADPNAARLEAGIAMGAARTVAIERGGGQAAHVRAASRAGTGTELAIDCTGIPAVWNDAIESVRTGGLVNLFGGCAPGTEVALDTHRVHYSEITLKGVYHHRPDTFRRALAMLADPAFPADVLLSDERHIDDVEAALRLMIDKRALKVVIRG